MVTCISRQADKKMALHLKTSKDFNQKMLAEGKIVQKILEGPADLTWMEGIGVPLTQVKIEPWKTPERAARETLQSRLAEIIGKWIWGQGTMWKKLFYYRSGDGSIRCKTTKRLVAVITYTTENGHVPKKIAWKEKWFLDNKIELPKEKKEAMEKEFWNFMGSSHDG